VRDVAFAAGVAAGARNFCRIFMVFAILAAILLIGYAGTCRMFAFLLVCHEYPPLFCLDDVPKPSFAWTFEIPAIGEPAARRGF
jgi:hypothetical protein